MSRLLVHQDQGELLVDTSDLVSITNELAEINVGFSRWQASKPVVLTASQEEILEIYADDVASVMKKHGFQSVDVVNLNSSMSGIDFAKARAKFLSEHIHTDDEVRFFIEGQGLFCLHVNNKVYQILCTQGDFISVPANIKHWFDMGIVPNFKCIRFFSDEAGWVADYTGDEIAKRFPLLDSLEATCKL